MKAESLAHNYDPYATWDSAKATDEKDGLPDRAIVPLVETLRARGIVTLQSCAGHLGTDDGCLWVLADSVDRESVLSIVGPPFSRVHFVHWPMEQWEFEWWPYNRREAVAALARLRSVQLLDEARVEARRDE